MVITISVFLNQLFWHMRHIIRSDMPVIFKSAARWCGWVDYFCFHVKDDLSKSSQAAVC